MIVLPRDLQDAVAERLRRVEARTLARAAQALSERYRGARTEGARLAQSPGDVAAYAGWMLPATFAQVSGALRMLPLRLPGFTPRRVLDLGAGPGTAAWAACAIWPSIEVVTMVEREPAFVELGRELMAVSPHPALRAARWRQDDLRDLDLRGERYDLVLLAHVTNEMASAEAGLLLREAWGSCEGALVVVEPGTPAGFERVEALRRALLAAGAHAVAPCPHGAACPLAAAAEETRAALRPGRRSDAGPPSSHDWCHFAERLQRPEFQRRLKGAEMGWEDAKFSFFAASRSAASSLPWARVLRHPVHGKGHVELDLCAREGRRRLVLGRKAATWKEARKLEWGDALPQPPSLDDPPQGEP